MSHPNQLVVIAAVLDVHQLTLYKEDGSTFPIPQGDPRIEGILKVCQAGLKKLGDQVTVDLTEANHYADFEKKTGGLIKLFRVAKSKVKDFFNKTEVKASEPITLGIVPTAKDVPAMTAVVSRKVQPLDTAIADIMAHATPVAAETFVEPQDQLEEDEPDTMIAVVNNQVIPDVAKLKPQMAAAVLRPTATTKGMEAFMTRIAAVMGKRRHSVEDLMQFLSKGDLPIADDGSIVIYKILKRKAGETFVDVHSGNVLQKVGSYVHMDESLVDPDRRQDCSNGLHVASRSYLGSFTGDVVVLAKVAPEDVIAVPQYNVNKMRVCGYHILALLSHDTYKNLKQNQPMTSTYDQELLGQAISGNHIGVLERVKITAAKGGGLEITQVAQMQPSNDKAPVVLAEPLPENGFVADPVDVKAVAKEVLAEKEAAKTPAEAGIDAVTEADIGVGKLTPPPAPKFEVTEMLPKYDPPTRTKKLKPVKKLSLKEQAAVLFDGVLGAVALERKEALAAQLVQLKKTSKKSWDALGISESNVAAILQIAAPALPQKGAIFTDEATIAKAEKKAVPKARKAGNERLSSTGNGPFSAPTPKPTKASAAAVLKERTDLHALVLTGDKDAAIKLRAHQKAKKKGWAALGLPADTGDVITQLIGK